MCVKHLWTHPKAVQTLSPRELDANPDDAWTVMALSFWERIFIFFYSRLSCFTQGWLLKKCAAPNCTVLQFGARKCSRVARLAFFSIINIYNFINNIILLIFYFCQYVSLLITYIILILLLFDFYSFFGNIYILMMNNIQVYQFNNNIIILYIKKMLAIFIFLG